MVDQLEFLILTLTSRGYSRESAEKKLQELFEALDTKLKDVPIDTLAKLSLRVDSPPVDLKKIGSVVLKETRMSFTPICEI